MIRLSVMGVGKPFECVHYSMIFLDAGLGEKKILFRPPSVCCLIEAIG